jgi:hypothetical protein
MTLPTFTKNHNDLATSELDSFQTQKCKITQRSHKRKKEESTKTKTTTANLLIKGPPTANMHRTLRSKKKSLRGLAFCSIASWLAAISSTMLLKMSLKSSISSRKITRPIFTLAVISPPPIAAAVFPISIIGAVTSWSSKCQKHLSVKTAAERTNNIHTLLVENFSKAAQDTNRQTNSIDENPEI